MEPSEEVPVPINKKIYQNLIYFNLFKAHFEPIFSHKRPKHDIHCENLIYFTNLSKEEFSADEVIELYSKRWDIEVSYKTMKTTQEIERHISLNGDVARNDIYAKVLFHNIVGVLRKEINHELEKRQTEKNMS